MLKVGDEAKPFEVEDVNGRKWNLDNFPGDYLLISFMRGAECPFCNLRLMELENHEDKLKFHNLTNYLLYHATKEQLVKNMERLSPSTSCRMLPDPDLKIHQLYETGKSYLGTLLTFTRIGKILQTITKGVFTLSPIGDPPLIPADFLIDKSGKILLSHYGRDYTDNIYLEDVFRKIEDENR